MRQSSLSVRAALEELGAHWSEQKRIDVLVDFVEEIVGNRQAFEDFVRLHLSFEQKRERLKGG